MGSLLELLFDTMPLHGAAGALHQKDNGTALRDRTVGELSQHLSFVPFEDYQRLLYKSQKVPATTSQVQDSTRTTDDIWGFDAQTSSKEVKALTCQVSGDDYKRYTVLEKLEFGHDDGSAFTDSIKVVFDQGEYAMRLTDEACVATFLVQSGHQPEKHHALWPLPAKHERALLRVFVYDVDFLAKTATPLSKVAAPNADAAQLQKFKDACGRLKQPNQSSEKVGASLFGDDLWRPAAKAPVTAPVSPADKAAEAHDGAAPGGSTKASGGVWDKVKAGAQDAASEIVVRVSQPRVVICCSVTLHRESDNFTPGNIAWSARLDPHIMVRATEATKEIVAAVRLTRPAQMKVEEAACGCGEMNQEMSSLLITDTNGDNKILIDVPLIGAPQGFWHNLFNYYLPDPHAQVGTKQVKVVDRTKTSARTIKGAIEREADPDGTITRKPRQGAFDNLHIAPPMKVPTVTSWMFAGPLSAFASEFPPVKRESWRLDKVYMAPICAHDCFHMHWRWTDSVNGHVPAYGFYKGVPYAEPGRPMVPENQDVYLRMENRHTVVYRASAYDAPADAWQTFVHHGSTYAVQVKPHVDSGRAVLDATPATENGIPKPDPLDNGGAPKLTARGPIIFRNGLKSIGSGDSWAVFYWNLRYYPERVGDNWAPKERVTILDLDYLITETKVRRR